MTWHTESFAIEKEWWCGEIKGAHAQDLLKQHCAESTVFT